MARIQRKIKRRNIEPDPIHGSVLVAKLINKCMRNGQKKEAEKQVFGALKIVKEELKEKAVSIAKLLEELVNTLGPRQEVRARRIGGASYQIPVPVRGTRKTALALKWLVEGAKKRDNKVYRSFAAKLAVEIMDTLNNQGEASKKRDSIHRMAEANKAFAHFRW